MYFLKKAWKIKQAKITGQYKIKNSDIPTWVGLKEEPKYMSYFTEER